MRKNIKHVLIILCFLILGSILSCGLSVLWYSGANTFWKRIDYFPYPVKKIIALKPFGKEFWVETIENEIYQITYPCLEVGICWKRSENVPSDPTDGQFIDYKVSNDRCKNNNFVYPLPHVIKMCVTSVVFGEALWTTSLALTNNDKLWIWNKAWIPPDTMLLSIVASTIFGLIIGLLVGLFLIQKSPQS